LTESPSGLYGQNRNDIIRYNGSFNLSDATAAYLTFMVRHRAENFRDKLEVQVSTNGSTWIPLAGSTTVEEPGTLDGNTIDGDPALTGIQEDWVPEVYNLSAFIGQPALQLRFVFSSDANTTGYDFQVDEGFNIDNLKVIKSTTTLVVLPVHFISFTGQLKPDNTAGLNWQVSFDSDPNYFSIERSVNGTNFWEAGRVGGQQFDFIDRDLFAGNNFYRIKAVGMDRTATYSSIINIVYKPNLFTVLVYPNPVKDEIGLRMTGNVAGTISIRVTDLSGRVVYSEPSTILSSPAEMKINSSWWAQGFYYLQVTDDKHNILATEKILKQ
jgi:carboxypeptidase T